MNLDRSHEFCFKRLIYRYLLETGLAPKDLPCGPCSVNIFKCCVPADAKCQISGL